MIIRDGAGIHTLICDNCYEEVEMTSFEDCVAYTKEQRWGLAKEDGDWKNYCRDCKDKRQLWDEFSDGLWFNNAQVNYALFGGTWNNAGRAGCSRVDDVYDDLFRAQLELQRISLKIDDLKLEIKKD